MLQEKNKKVRRTTKSRKKRPPKVKLIVKNFGEPTIDSVTGKSVMHPGITKLVQLLAKIAVEEYLEELRGEKPPFKNEGEKV